MAALPGALTVILALILMELLLYADGTDSNFSVDLDRITALRG